MSVVELMELGILAREVLEIEVTVFEVGAFKRSDSA